MKKLLCALILILASSPYVEAALVHRWTFDVDGSDSVGGAHAMLQGGASISAGQLRLGGSGAHASLPIDSTLSGLGSASFEIWATHDQLSSWARLFDFGNGTSTSNPSQGYLFLTASPQYSSISSFAQFSITQSSNSNSENVYAGAVPGPGQEVHFVVVIDAVAELGTVYVNGRKLLEDAITLTPGEVVQMDGQEDNWLGRSRFNSNAFLNGSINEFRIHDGALSAAEALASYHLGPSASTGALCCELLQPTRSQNAFSFQVATFDGFLYDIQYTDSLSLIDWILLETLTGDDTTQLAIDESPKSGRFYRARIRETQPAAP